MLENNHGVLKFELSEITDRSARCASYLKNNFLTPDACARRKGRFGRGAELVCRPRVLVSLSIQDQIRSDTVECGSVDRCARITVLSVFMRFPLDDSVLTSSS